MTTAARPRQSAGALLVVVLLGAQSLRLVASLVGGIANATDNLPIAPSRFHNGYVLVIFGSAGDGVGLVILALAAGLLWAQVGRLTSPAQTTQWWRQHDLAVMLLGLTAIAAAVNFTGLLMQASVPQDSWRQVVAPAGFQLTYFLAALGAMVAVRRLDADPIVGDVEADDDEAGPAAVFAVDRKTGDVLAWPSPADARAKAPLYGVEDDEFDWFLDDGEVLQATAVGRDVTFAPTGAQRPDELLRHLKAYVDRRGIAIDDDEDEPLAYVDPIGRDHYLAMWPGWLRWLGRLTR